MMSDGVLHSYDVFVFVSFCSILQLTDMNGRNILTAAPNVNTYSTNTLLP